MHFPVRQGSSITLKMGPFLSDTDGKTHMDALTIQKADVRITVNGGDYGAASADQGASDAGAPYDENGDYDISLNATDTATVGRYKITIKKAGALQVFDRITVIEEAVYDRDYAAAATGIVGTAQTGDSFAIVNSGTHGNAALKTLIDAVDNIVDTEIGALQTSVDDLPTNAELATALGTADDAVLTAIAALPTAAENADAVWDEVIDTSAHNGADSAGQKLRRASSKFLAEGTVDPTGATTTSFRTDLTEDDDHWNDALLTFISGDLAGQSRTILDYANVNGLITLDEALTGIPAGGVKFIIESTHIHPVTQVATAVWASPDLDAAIQAALGLASANLDTQLADLPTVAEFEARTLAAADYATDASQTNQDTEIADIQTTLAALFTTALTESYAADGATQTVAQLLYKIDAHLSEVAITGTEKRLNRLDGTTQAMTFALNSAVTPTAITRDG